MTQIDELERAAAWHWQAPETEHLGEWLLRAADGFTGRANSALPLGDPGVPLPEAVAAVTDWYLRRRLPPMIVVPLPLADARGPWLDNFLAERSWALRSGPALVMTAAIADIPVAGLRQHPAGRTPFTPPFTRPSAGRDGQRPGPCALRPLRFPRRAPLPLPGRTATRGLGAWVRPRFSLRLSVWRPVSATDLPARAAG
jgi:hypothetical protein